MFWTLASKTTIAKTSLLESAIARFLVTRVHLIFWHVSKRHPKIARAFKPGNGLI
jgi:hypothetical protein